MRIHETKTRITAFLGTLSLFSLAATGCNEERIRPLQLDLVAEPPQTVSFKIQNYQPQPGRQFKDLFVSNYSVILRNGSLYYSSARDGLDDQLKEAKAGEYGFVLQRPDSNNDGYGDLLMWQAGVPTINQNTLFCGANLRSTSSNDAIVFPDRRFSNTPLRVLGLRDCEKMYMNLDPKSFDNDNDGVPDYLELRCGMNPKNPNDAHLSIAGDPMSNVEKCKRHLPHDEHSNSQPNKLHAYEYVMDRSPSTGVSSFEVKNVTVMDGGRDNLVAFYLTEVDLSDGKTYLYTAYTVLRANSAGSVFKFDFWGLDLTKQFNQELVF